MEKWLTIDYFKTGKFDSLFNFCMSSKYFHRLFRCVVILSNDSFGVCLTNFEFKNIKFVNENLNITSYKELFQAMT